VKLIGSMNNFWDFSDLGKGQDVTCHVIGVHLTLTDPIELGSNVSRFAS